MASAIYGSSSTSNTRTLQMLEPACIAGISKTPYVPATARFLEWRCDLPRAGTNTTSSDSNLQDPYRGPPRRDRGDRRPRLRGAGVLVLDGRIACRRPSQ